MRRTLLALLLLAACGEGTPAPEAASFRSREVPIGSTTRGAPADLNGEWVVSQAYRQDGLRGVLPGDRLSVAMDASGTGRWTFPGGGGTRVAVPVAAGGPGRYRTQAPQPAAAALLGTPAPDLWVLWADDDFRTAVVGTPDGTLGWIMDRPGAASPDRAAAAREVLDFNGYDLGRLAP